MLVGIKKENQSETNFSVCSLHTPPFSGRGEEIPKVKLFLPVHPSHCSSLSIDLYHGLLGLLQ